MSLIAADPLAAVCLERGFNGNHDPPGTKKRKERKEKEATFSLYTHKGNLVMYKCIFHSKKCIPSGSSPCLIKFLTYLFLWQFLETNIIWDHYFVASNKKWYKRTLKTETDSKILKSNSGSSCCGSAETNLICIHEDTGSNPGLAQWAKDLVLPWAVV